MSDFEKQLFPILDERAKKIQVVPEIVPYCFSTFYEPVPRIIHQIWFMKDAVSPPPNQYVKSWEMYCITQHYQYMFWNDENSDWLANLLTEEGLIGIFEVMKKFRAMRSMSDIARYAILKHYGGIYVDCDFPCSIRAPLEELFPMSNITFMTERLARNVGQNSGLFVCTSFIMSPPNHPILRRVIASLPANVMSTMPDHEWIMTGSMLLNRCLYGVLNIIPFNYSWFLAPLEEGAPF